MKALSIQQPWAWAILHGKDIENRTWMANYRGEFFIHAGKRIDRDGYVWLLKNEHLLTCKLPHIQQFETGGIVGIAKIIDCVTKHSSPFFFGPYGFVLADQRDLGFTPWKGQLGWFDVDLGYIL